MAEAFGVDTEGMDQPAYRKAAVDAVRRLSVDVGIPVKLEKLREEDLPFLCASAAADACAPGNPRHAELADFEAMFRKLM
ncbi:MAG: iron-containing alcohol dehydrogenase [Clostridia bacterium]|nr:iron-containing alcohol dehydrogenase [Clostridia bacterium]